MTDRAQEERNAITRKRILDLKDFRVGKFPADSPWVKPARLHYIQDGKEKIWDVMKIHDSVSILIFNMTRKKLVFVRQFRAATYYNSLPEKHDIVDVKRYPATLGLTLELCSGIVDKDKSLVEIAQDELKEECGYEAPLSAFERVASYRFVANSGATQTLFYVEVTDEMHIHPGGGAESEGELIEIVDLSIPEIKAYISSEEILSPPCFLYGVTWFLMNKQKCYC